LTWTSSLIGEMDAQDADPSSSLAGLTVSK